MGRKTRIVEICMNQAQTGFNDQNKHSHHGAVLIKGGSILGMGHNNNLRTCVMGQICPSVHAEVAALISSSLRQCELHGSQQSKVV